VAQSLLQTLKNNYTAEIFQGSCPMLKIVVVSTLAWIFLFLPTQFAQGAQPSDEVTRTVRAEMAKQHIPGLALLVSRKGVSIRTEGFGLSNVELNVPVTPKTIFQSGSVGKQFTAAAVMLLVEEGKIGLSDPLSKYFADGPGWWKDVTIRELLSHTAGFTDYPKDFDLRKDYSEEELLKIVEAIPPAYPPGTDWAYSNLGYVTLGILIHKVSGQYFGDFLQERIFKPLGMSTTRIISEADIIPNRAAGYRWDNGQLKNQEWVSQSANSTADGSLYFTLLDVAKWDAALYTEKVLKEASKREMWTPALLSDGEPNKASYGFAWFVESQNGHRVVEHEGRWQGFEAQISRYLDDGLTVVVLVNSGTCDPHLIADEVAAIYLAKGTLSK
jgi:CubicO group peptidase (beta-lactamase class C family)